MTKNELIGLLYINLMNSLRQRDNTDSGLFVEESGYYNGQYRAYESIIGILAPVDIASI